MKLSFLCRLVKKKVPDLFLAHSTTPLTFYHHALAIFII